MSKSMSTATGFCFGVRDRYCSGHRFKRDVAGGRTPTSFTTDTTRSKKRISPPLLLFFFDVFKGLCYVTRPR